MKIDWREFLGKYDFSFFIIMFIIFLIGVFNLYSATHNESSISIRNLYLNQIVWFLVAVGFGFFISIFNTKTFNKFSYVTYIAIIILLVVVLLAGKVGMGAKRWIDLGPFHLQPSELMKIALVMTLARWFTLHDPDYPLNVKTLIIPTIFAIIPAAMIIAQPDLGSGLLLLFIFAFLVFYRKISWKIIINIAILGIITSGIMYKYVLKEYQQKRIEMFLNPYKDAKGSGYNAIQSEIAIGSGKILGKGFKKSTQASLSYLPENHTDFVFSIYNEEHGLVGSMVLILLYLVLLLKLMALAKSVNSIYDSFLVVGITAIFFWHTFINMSMVAGLMPIVGIPLPMMSYGGSSLLTFGICIGLATSVSNSKNMFVSSEFTF
jgi:rod shape determining protein RodA